MNKGQLDKEKVILEAIRKGDPELFQEISKLSRLLDFTFGSKYFRLRDFGNSLQEILKTLHQKLREKNPNTADILQAMEPQLLAIEQEQATKEKTIPKLEEHKMAELPILPKASGKGVEKGPYKKPVIENLESQEIADVFCVCAYDFEEIEKLVTEEKEKLKLFVMKKLISFETKEPLKITMRGDLKKYQIVEEINIADELGEWRFHPFFDKMAVYLIRNGDLSFPIKWHVPKDFSLSIETRQRRSSEKAFSGGSETLLGFLEELAEKYEKDKEQAKIWAETFNGQAVDSVDELLKWEKRDLDELTSIPKQIKLVLLQELNKFKFKGMSETQTNLNDAERQGIVHKIRRFLYFQAGEEDKLGYINQNVLELALNDVKTYYEGESLLKQIRTFYMGYSVPMRKKGNIVLERGMILYGPPGTGKTVLTDDLPLKIGLTPISHSLSASEVNRSLVGQTEKLLLDLCNRARKMPHLLCCVSIDEIDSLVPKRDEKSSQHKTDGIAVLLAVIGGIKDVPNLVILASTNRLNQIDDAIKRRLSGQFFVGRPSPASRKKIIQRVNKEKDEDTGSELVIMDEKEIEETVKMTTNFSGAALKMLISKLLVFYKTEKKKGKLTLEEITIYATLTSKQFSIKLGTFYLPDLFQKRLDDQKVGLVERVEVLCTRKANQRPIEMKSGCPIDEMLVKTLGIPYEKNLKYGFTGRILVNLSDMTKTTIEYQLKDQLQLFIEERKMMSSTLNDLLPRFSDFVAERNIDYIQLFNSDFLLDSNAFDESKIMENINEKLQELGAYDRSLLIIDMDSLCGVNVSKSESGMGPTSSSSLSNPKLFNFSIHSINTKVQMTVNKEIWIALACKNRYLMSVVKESMNWRKTPKQIEQDINEKENNTKVKVCKKCRQKYYEVENKLGCCSYHDGFLFKSAEKPELWEPIIDESIINALKAHPKIHELGLKYICCKENFTSQGCKKDKHGDRFEDVPNYFDELISLKKKKSLSFK